MTDTFSPGAVLEEFRKRLRQESGEAFHIESLLDLNPVMTEVKVIDQTSKRPFCARLYHIRDDQRDFLKQAWKMSANDPDQPKPKLPQPSYGLKTMGPFMAHVAAFIPGMDLASYLAETGPCHQEYAVRMGVQLLKTLESLAQQDVAHHLLKPSDIILGQDGKLILKNAGLSIFEMTVASKLNLDGLQDARYASPEQLEGRPPNQATDIYLAGLIIYEILAGRPPFEGDEAEVRDGHLTKAIPDPRTFNPNAGIGLARILAKALAKNPEERFKDLGEMRQTLEMMLPVVERSVFMKAGPRKLSEKDEAKLAEQFAEAKSLASQKNLPAALKAMDAVLMVSGPRNDLIMFYRKVWQALNGAIIRQSLEKAQQAQAAGQPAEVLKTLNQVFSLQAYHPQAAEMQAAVFKEMEDRVMRTGGALPLAKVAERAIGADEEANPVLARSLWISVLLTGDMTHPARDSALQALGLTSAPSAAPVPELTAAPGFDDFDEIVDTPSQASAPPPPPPSDMPVFDPNEDLIGMPDEEEEDLIGVPEEPALETPQRPARKPMPKLLVMGGIAAVLVVVLVVGILMVSQSKERARAEEAFQAAATIESTGDWEGALEAWASVNREFPNFKFKQGSAEERHRTLEYKLKERERLVTENLQKAESLLAQDIPVYEMPDNPLNYITIVLGLDPQNLKAAELKETIRIKESRRAWTLWEEKKVPEAREALRFLGTIDPNYVDAELKANIDEWTQVNLIDPQLAKLDNALKRKKWEDAFEVTEELEGLLDDPSQIRERWEGVYAEYETQYFEAKDKGDQQKVLSMLTVMTRIRPDDVALREEKDQLNRDLNLERINSLERQIRSALKANSLTKACKLGQQLKALESENAVANEGISRFRTFYETKIKNLKSVNPREAVKTYNTLISQLNWRSHRRDRDTLKKRVSAFDAAVGGLKKAKVDNFDQHKAELNRVIADYSDFKEDKNYAWLNTNLNRLEKDHQRLQTLLQWEADSRGDVKKTYSAILTHINQQKGFAHPYAQRRVRQLKDFYSNRIENYEGNATIVIRSASGLPKGRGFGRGPRAYCQLETGGKTFRTEPAAATTKPEWNYTCNYNAKQGDKLVFSIYNKKNNQLIGTAELPKVPKNIKNMKVTSKEGWTITIDVKRER